MNKFILSPSDNYQDDVNDACTSTSRYQEELLHIDNPYFEKLESWILTRELHVLGAVVLLLLIYCLMFSVWFLFCYASLVSFLVLQSS